MDLNISLAGLLKKQGKVNWEGITRNDIVKALAVCGQPLQMVVKVWDQKNVDYLKEMYDARVVGYADFFQRMATMKVEPVPPGPFMLDPLVRGSKYWSVLPNKLTVNRDGKDVIVACNSGIAMLKGTEMQGAPKVKVMPAMLAQSVSSYCYMNVKEVKKSYQENLPNVNAKYDQTAAGSHFVGAAKRIHAAMKPEVPLSGLELSTKVYSAASSLSLYIVAKLLEEGNAYDPLPVKERMEYQDVKVLDPDGNKVVCKVKKNVKNPPVPASVLSAKSDVAAQEFIGNMTSSVGGMDHGIGHIVSSYVDGVPLSPSLRKLVNLWTYVKLIDFEAHRSVAINVKSRDIALWLWKQASMVEVEGVKPLVFWIQGRVTTDPLGMSKIMAEGGVITVADILKVPDALYVNLDFIDVSVTSKMMAAKTAVEGQIAGRKAWLGRKFMARIPLIGTKAFDDMLQKAYADDLERVEREHKDKVAFLELSTEKKRGSTLTPEEAELLAKTVPKEDISHLYTVTYHACVESCFGQVVVTNATTSLVGGAADLLVPVCKLASYARHRYFYYRVPWEILRTKVASVMPSLSVGQIWNLAAKDVDELLEGEVGLVLSEDLLIRQDEEFENVVKGSFDLMKESIKSTEVKAANPPTVNEERRVDNEDDEVVNEDLVVEENDEALV